MAQIIAPTAAEIYQRSSLDAEHFEWANDDDDVLAHIESHILPNVIGKVEAVADDAATPHDFPLSDSVIAQAKPTWTVQQRTERVSYQQGRFKSAILNYAVADLHDAVDSAQEVYIERAKYFRSLADADLKAGIQSVQSLTAVTSATQSEKRQPTLGSFSVPTTFGF